jgi:hypothetical protein
MGRAEMISHSLLLYCTPAHYIPVHGSRGGSRTGRVQAGFLTLLLRRLHLLLLGICAASLAFGWVESLYFVLPKCTAGPPRMDHLRAYIHVGFSYIKYSRTSFIPFYYITEVLNLRSHTRRPSWAAQWPKRPNRRPKAAAR